ncbi:MAG: AAA family ATPase [Chloroflexota bacterium]
MRISHIELYSWKNFRKASVYVPERVFLVGPNASGKSNFLDALRFLRDLAARTGGGLQRACAERGGVSKMRCLAARQDPEIGITIELTNGDNVVWRYEIKFKKEKGGNRLPRLTREAVYKSGQLVLERPDADDERDPLRLTETALEQINRNALFRELAQAVEKIAYLHLVPQIIRAGGTHTNGDTNEAYGQNFLERLAKTNDKTRGARLRRIQEALTIAVPQLKELRLERDERGAPHLVGAYAHWRPKAAKQTEEQFSDGTLRLLGLLWSLQEGDGPLLLEEPELSLHSSIIRRLPELIHRIQRARKRQVFISTHSMDLLSDPGIGAEEILMLIPSAEGTQVKSAVSVAEIRALMQNGMTAAEAVVPHTEPPLITQLELFE